MTSLPWQLGLAAAALWLGCASSQPDAAHASGHDAHGGHDTHASGHNGHGGTDGGDHFHKRFDKADEWAKVFDDPARDAWQKPDELIAALKLSEAAKVADIGAGTGYFAVRIAKAAPKGMVYGVDIEADMVRYLDERAAKEKLPNVKGVLAGEAGPNLPEPVDLVLVVDTYHHLPKRVEYFKALASSLRPGGRVVIVDFTKEAPMGPPPAHRLSAAEVEAELGQAGYTRLESLPFLPHQYALIFGR